jgi:hypothetical protein
VPLLLKFVIFFNCLCILFGVFQLGTSIVIFGEALDTVMSSLVMTAHLFILALITVGITRRSWLSARFYVAFNVFAALLFITNSALVQVDEMQRNIRWTDQIITFTIVLGGLVLLTFAVFWHKDYFRK